MVRSKKKQTAQLTDVELEMMTIIWEIGPASVHQVMERLPAGRTLAYTSVSTMVRILEQKAFVSSQKDGRGHLYAAAVSKSDYEASSVAHLIKNVFHGEPSQLVNRLLSSQDLSEDDLSRIREILEERAKP